MSNIRYTTSDCFLKYPYKKRQYDNLYSEGKYHFPKSEIVDNHKFSLTRKEFNEIAKTLFDLRFEELLKGEQILLPGRSGLFELKKYKNKYSKAIDWGSTNKIYKEYNKNNKDKKFIYHKNYHTNGYRLLIFWDKRKCVMINKHMYKFRLTRKRNEELNKYFRTNISAINNINES